MRTEERTKNNWHHGYLVNPGAEVHETGEAPVRWAKGLKKERKRAPPTPGERPARGAAPSQREKAGRGFKRNPTGQFLSQQVQKDAESDIQPYRVVTHAPNLQEHYEVNRRGRARSTCGSFFQPIQDRVKATRQSVTSYEAFTADWADANCTVEPIVHLKSTSKPKTLCADGNTPRWDLIAMGRTPRNTAPQQN